MTSKVYVALSGGVDSSVAAALLQEQGYDVTGVFIRVWQADFLPCTQDEDEKWAKRVAAHLAIPFEVLDLSGEYKKDIVEPMIESYKKGETPNPDVLCNRYIKFGPFLHYAKEHGVNYIATGHHAQVAQADGSYTLLRGVDPKKDQAYFLWMLTQEDLQQTLMPVGSMMKGRVRKEAERFKLPTAMKKDSQGLCFLGDVQIQEFLKHFITTEPGEVLNSEGKVIGVHSGAVLYTLGQRTGFTITTEAVDRPTYYVIKKDIHKNTITVAPNTKSVAHSAIDEIKLDKTNWIHKQPEQDVTYQCEIRYHGTAHSCRIQCTDSQAVITPNSVIQKVAPGQSVVVYDGDVVLGGGIAR